MLDPDLAQILRSLAEEEDRPLSHTITHYLKKGLAASGHPTALTVSYVGSHEEPPPPDPDWQS